MVNFKIESLDKVSEFTHYWKKCVGSCHAYTGLREDWRVQLKKVREELGFEYIRFHGLLDDDMSVYLKKQWSDEIRISFFNIDSVFDFLLSIGIKPFVELGFMPEAMASGSTTCFNYKANVTPPKDYEEWGRFIKLFVEHLVERYGIEEVKTWYFEVWNEPNLKYFWDGTMEEYFKLYKYTAEAVKSVDGDFRVGGPATSINAWIPQMIEFCSKTGTPLDFISTHHYPTDDPLWKNNDMKMEEFFKIAGSYERGALKKMATKANAEAGSYPLYYTEWNTSALATDHFHDEPYAAALVAKTLADNDGLVDIYSFWTFSDIFEEGGQPSTPFHGGFGLQTIHGIPKPTYRLFELMNSLGNCRLEVISEQNSTVELLATKKDSKVVMLAYNHNIPGEAIEEQEITITLPGSFEQNAVIIRIDDNNANPKAKWLELGGKEYPSAAELDLIHQASKIEKTYIKAISNGNETEVTLTIPAHGVAQITLSQNNE